MCFVKKNEKIIELSYCLYSTVVHNYSDNECSCIRSRVDGNTARISVLRRPVRILSR